MGALMAVRRNKNRKLRMTAREAQDLAPPVEEPAEHKASKESPSLEATAAKLGAKAHQLEEQAGKLEDKAQKLEEKAHKLEAKGQKKQQKG